MMETRVAVGVVIPALNGAKELAQLLPVLISEDPHVRVLVIDSESTDSTEASVREHPRVLFHRIARAEFNHGATRELGRRLVNSDIVVFLTQDVIPYPGFLQKLVHPIVTGQAVVAYARQLPHLGADRFEAFPREFNYPQVSHRRTLADAASYGVYTFFCSDSCSAYSNRALDAIGGFEPTLTNEDYFAVAKLLRAGGAIAYVAEAEVLHSHRYTLRQEFQRYFDTGYVRAENPWVTQLVGQAEKRGSAMAASFLRHIGTRQPWMLPYAVLQLVAKWAGYRAGYLGYRWPKCLCIALTSQRYYWESRFSRHPRP